MMLPTHAVVGLAIATPIAVLAPELAPAALLGGLLGGILPDLDMYVGHRRTLHFPTGYSLLALPTIILALVRPDPALVGFALLLASAALHCRMDRYGGGLELRPWEATSERAVYDHVLGRWHRPKRWIRYDGAPEDLLATVGVGVPLLFLLDPPFRWIVGGAIAVGVAYTVLRRHLLPIGRAICARLPSPIAGRVPARYQPVDEHSG